MEVPLRCSGLRIQCCCSCGTGCNCSAGSIPSPGNFCMLQVRPKKKKKRKRKKIVSGYFCDTRVSNVPCADLTLCNRIASSWEPLGWHYLLSVHQTSSLLHLEHSRGSINADSPSSLIHPVLGMLQIDGLCGAVTLGFGGLGWKCRGTLGLPPQCTNIVTAVFLIADWSGTGRKSVCDHWSLGVVGRR